MRLLLLEAAERLFAQVGYAEVTTDEIAAEAGVTRSVMYRHFPTKADLFREAVLSPFLDFLRDYRRVLDGRIDESRSADQTMRAMVSILYDSLREHRDAMLGLVSTRASIQPEVTREVDRLFDEFFADMLVIGVHTSRPVGWIPLEEDLELSIRLVLGMVAAAALLDPIFMPKGRRRPSRAQIIDRLSALAMYGLRLQAP